MFFLNHAVLFYDDVCQCTGWLLWSVLHFSANSKISCGDGLIFLVAFSFGVLYCLRNTDI